MTETFVHFCKTPLPAGRYVPPTPHLLGFGGFGDQFLGSVVTGQGLELQDEGLGFNKN